MDIIAALITIFFGLAALVVALQWLAAILMLVVPLSPARRAAIVQQLRAEQQEYRRQSASLRAQIFEPDSGE